MVQSATDRSIPNFMNEKLFYPLGLEHKAYYQTDEAVVAFVFERIKYLNTRLQALWSGDPAKWKPTRSADCSCQLDRRVGCNQRTDRPMGNRLWISVVAVHRLESLDNL